MEEWKDEMKQKVIRSVLMKFVVKIKVSVYKVVDFSKTKYAKKCLLLKTINKTKHKKFMSLN